MSNKTKIVIGAILVMCGITLSACSGDFVGVSVSGIEITEHELTTKNGKTTTCFTFRGNSGSVAVSCDWEGEKK